MFRTLRPSQMRVELSIAGLFAVVGLAVYSSANSSSMIGPLVAHLIFAGALALRRVSPSLSLAAAWVASLFQMATDQNSTYSDLAVLALGDVASRPRDVENSGNSTLPDLLSASRIGPRR